MNRTRNHRYPDPPQSPFSSWWNSRTFIQQRLIRSSLSMLVMILCLPLYYAGFFGNVEGPLNPDRIGDALAGFGATRTHVLVLLLSFLIIAASWNWIYNLVCLGIGRRLTCRHPSDDTGTVCGAAVKRGRTGVQYVCESGHTRRDAHFHPVRKGTVSHTLWVISLCFCIIVVLMS